MAHVWYHNPDVSVPYGTLTGMYVLKEEARFPIFEGKRLYRGYPYAFLQPKSEKEGVRKKKGGENKEMDDWRK